MNLVPPPPPLLSNGMVLLAGTSVSTVIADFDFETYSEAGYEWSEENQDWQTPRGARAKGLAAVGAAVYSEHATTEVLCMAYDLKDGKPPRLWTPEKAPPNDLFQYLENGGLLEAWNVSFEYLIWQNVCVKKYRWPPISRWVSQLRCAAAKARAHALPGGLAAAGAVLQIDAQKDKDGKRLLTKFSMPRKPTKANPAKRIRVEDDPEDAKNLYFYNLQDIKAESAVSTRVPDLSKDELEFWQCDQAINRRGVCIDIESVKNAISIIDQAGVKYNSELYRITKGQVESATQVAKIIKWADSQGVFLPALNKDVVGDVLSTENISAEVRRVLEIRSTLSSASIKKLHAMLRLITKDGRIKDLFLYHKARTGRASGLDVQPQNMPNSGPNVKLCECGKYSLPVLTNCPWCGSENIVIKEWNPDAVEQALQTINTGDLACLNFYWGNDPLKIIGSCLRGLVVAGPGRYFISSDYSAIEAVINTFLSGETWRLEIFKTHGKIYETSAAKITNVPLEEILAHKESTGSHHKLRTLGKVAELSLGFQGGLGAFKASLATMGLESSMTDEEIQTAVRGWRAASPNIVNFWYGLDRAAKSSILNPGVPYDYRGIKYLTSRNIMYCTLLSGRQITYHNVGIEPGKYGDQISYWGWNTNSKNGPVDRWIKMYLYGGKLAENVIQATARDILSHAIVNLEKEGYPVVLHVHDEIVCEVPEGFGSVQELENIMNTLPSWAAGCPIVAKGGWAGKRYRK